MIKFSLQGTKGTKKIPDFKKSSNKKKGQTAPDEPSGKVQCLVHVHIMCTLNRAVPTRNPNHILRPGRVRLLAPGSRECVHALTGSSSNLLPLPFICSQTYSFMNFFHYIPSSPICWTVFSKLLFNTSLIPEAVPAHPGTSPMVVLQGYTGCLGDGQMPVHEAKLWFRRVDPFLSVTLS